MTELTPGPELDAAIAEACGARIGLAFFPPNIWTWPDSTVVDVPNWNPSTDLNCAFEAAERAGLFSETFWRTLGMDELGETWCVFEQDGNRKSSLTRNYPTPALAICAAILKLKEQH